jgi:hypothetical protein
MFRLLKEISKAGVLRRSALFVKVLS